MKLPNEQSVSGLSRRPKLWLMTALVVAGVVFVVAVWPGEKEPEYQGKKLSEWVEYAVHERPRNTQVEQYVYALGLAKDATRAIGTNGLPYLIKWIQHERPGWRNMGSKAYGQLPRPLVINSIDHWLADASAEERANESVVCFQFLGPDAAPAVPELTRLLSASDPEIVRRAVVCLGSIGPKARAALPKLRELAKGPAGLGVGLDAAMAIHNIEGMDILLQTF